MKTFALFSCLGICLFQGSAQSIEIRDTLGNVLNGDTLYFNGLSTDFELLSEDLKIYNIGSTTIPVKAKRTEISVVTGTQTALCWTYCSSFYTAGTMPVLTAPGAAQNIASGGFREHLYALHYRPYGNPGSSCYQVVFFNTSNPNDSAWIGVCFTTEVGLNDIKENGLSLKAYPNPSSENISVSIEGFNGIQGNLIIFNSYGEIVNQIPVKKEEALISLTGIPSGIYSFSFQANDHRVCSGKFIVMPQK